jgi:hypothetical protein
VSDLRVHRIKKISILICLLGLDNIKACLIIKLHTSTINTKVLLHLKKILVIYASKLNGKLSIKTNNN